MHFDYNKPYIVGIGGANIDIHARLDFDAVMHDSNPAVVSSSIGGVTRNVLDNLSRQGFSTVLLSSLANDAFGQKITDECERVGIDMSHIYRSEAYGSGSYLALMDKDGELFVSACDARIIENIPLSYFEENAEIIKNASAIVCDPNLETSQLLKIHELCGEAKLFLDPVSTSKARKIKDILNIFYFIKPNKLELEELSGLKCKSDDDIAHACDVLLDKGVKCVAVSLGERGCYYKDCFGNELFRKLSGKIKLVDATGAGDAFMAGMVNGYVKKLPIEERLDIALASGAIAVQSSATINPEMSADLLKQYL